MRPLASAAFLLLTIAGVLHAQHGEAGAGYFPIGFAGDTWTGEVSAVNDDTREITLLYNGPKKSETFVGVLIQGYKAQLKDGSLSEVKLSLIPPGRRLKVFYTVKVRKVSGHKEKFNEIFRIDFLPN